MKMANNSSKTTDGVRQTIVLNLEAHPLQGVSVKEFHTFLRLIKLYEDQIEEKNREPGANVTPKKILKASVERKMLDMMTSAECIAAEDADCVTETQMKKCIEKRAKRSVDETQLENINLAIKDIKMSKKGDFEDLLCTN